jgi:predicted porin
LKGTEDLGGDLAAVFTLENGFELITGKLVQRGAKFERQAIVGLNSDRFGTASWVVSTPARWTFRETSIR